MRNIRKGAASLRQWDKIYTQLFNFFHLIFSRIKLSFNWGTQDI